MAIEVHLVDGTYELFRYFFALPSHVADDEQEVAAVRGVVGSMLMMVEDGATHVGVATDHVIESFRNDLWPGYKDGSGIDPALLSQFGLLEDTLRAAGFTVWAMVDVEADDALATAAARAAADERVGRVWICTPDKDLGQCVGGKVLQLDRRAEEIRDAAGVRAKFGVDPESIPDYLALVGDSADGFPGLPGWGAKSAAAVLARWGHLEAIPADPAAWDVTVRGAAKLAATLEANRELALLFRHIATTVSDAAEVDGTVDDWRWTGPPDPAAFAELCDRLDAPGLAERAAALGSHRASDTS